MKPRDATAWLARKVSPRRLVLCVALFALGLFTVPHWWCGRGGRRMVRRRPGPAGGALPLGRGLGPLRPRHAGLLDRQQRVQRRVALRHLLRRRHGFRPDGAGAPRVARALRRADAALHQAHGQPGAARVRRRRVGRGRHRVALRRHRPRGLPGLPQPAAQPQQPGRPRARLRGPERRGHRRADGPALDEPDVPAGDLPERDLPSRQLRRHRRHRPLRPRHRRRPLCTAAAMDADLPPALRRPGHRPALPGRRT